MSRDGSNDPTFDGGGVTRSSRITCKVKGDSTELKATRGSYIEKSYSISSLEGSSLKHCH